MIKGHGDDAYQYADIRMNFSSNICQQADLSALKAHLAARLDLIGHYPEPEAWSLERLIARRLGIPEQCVVVTSGATEAIYLVAQTFPYRQRIIVPTFREYEDACAMYPARSQKTALWACSPNNPTGHVLQPELIRRHAGQYDLVVIDQSYEDYTDAPTLSARQAVRMRNVILLHSLTKSYGVPGLRLGYITATASITRQLRRNLRPWAVNALAIEAGMFLIGQQEACRPDLQEAQRLWQALRQVSGIGVEPTQTSFMLCTIKGHTAAQLKDHLALHHGMLIRDASNFTGLSPHHFRIASQSPKENDALVEAIKAFV